MKHLKIFLVIFFLFTQAKADLCSDLFYEQLPALQRYASDTASFTGEAPKRLLDNPDAAFFLKDTPARVHSLEPLRHTLDMQSVDALVRAMFEKIDWKKLETWLENRSQKERDLALTPAQSWIFHPVMGLVPSAQWHPWRAQYIQSTLAFYSQLGKVSTEILFSEWKKTSGVAELFARQAELTPQVQPPKQPRPHVGLPTVLRRLLNGQEAWSIKVSEKTLGGKEEYKELMKNSVEVIFAPAGEYGHIYMRVGRRYYNLRGPRDVSFGDFSVRPGHAGFTGFLFKAPAELVKQIQGELDVWYAGSRDQNFPAYDLSFRPLRLVQKEDGSFRYESEGSRHFNDLDVGSEVKVTPTRVQLGSIEFPVVDGRVRSFTCTSIVSYVFNRFFGIQIPDSTPYMFLYQMLHGNPGGSKFDYMIEYQANE